MLGAQGIRATGFKRAQGNAHCAKFESHSNRVTFETNAIRMTSSVQALCSDKKISKIKYCACRVAAAAMFFFGNANVNGFCLKKHISSLCIALLLLQCIQSRRTGLFRLVIK